MHIGTFDDGEPRRHLQQRPVAAVPVHDQHLPKAVVGEAARDVERVLDEGRPADRQLAGVCPLCPVCSP